MATQPETPTLAEAIAELEAFYRLSTDLICVAAADGRFRRLNPAWETALGYPPDDLVGRAWMDLVHPDDAAKTIEAARSMSSGELLEFQNRYKHKNGTWVTLSWRASPWAGGLTYCVARVVG